MSEEELIETLKEFEKNRIEQLKEPSKNLFYAIMKIADERDKYKIILDNIKNNNKRIIDYGFDYDGFNNVEDLKELIDMLVDYARKNYELLEEIE